MKITKSAAEAKSHLGDLLRFAERGDQVVITRYGKPVAALVNADEFAQLERLKAAGPEAGLAGLVRRWRDSEELASELDRVAQNRHAAREVPALD